MFEDCCKYFNIDNLSKTNHVVEDICGAQLQENIYLHQEALPNNQEKEEGDIVKLSSNPQRPKFDELDGSPFYDLYYLDGKLGTLEQQ